MCLICVDLIKEKLTIREAYRNLGEMKSKIGQKHFEEVLDTLYQIELATSWGEYDNVETRTD